ncbi:MarR family winged helix-turn-helix transcriptional regulator [Staphylococcus carnosus]|uniref:MarR family winged helix-turn-helix transcriptional regulator n=1 Tax=Staphylococcus carnosus TaxID=1281 RepID=UPI003F9768A9
MNIEQLLNMQKFQRQLNLELSEVLKQINYEITLNEFYVLYFLKKSEGHSLSISELSQKNGLSISATSRMLVKFEQTCGVIKRHPGEDKRSVIITLTPKGEEYLNESLKSVEAVLQNYSFNFGILNKQLN